MSPRTLASVEVQRRGLQLLVQCSVTIQPPVPLAILTSTQNLEEKTEAAVPVPTPQLGIHVHRRMLPNCITHAAQRRYPD